MVDIFTGLLEDAQIVILGIIGVFALVFVVMTWARTRSLVPTIGALLFGALVLWGVSNFQFLQDQIDEDIQRNTDGGGGGLVGGVIQDNRPDDD